MDARKLILAAIAGSLAMWLLAGLWHLVIMAGYYAGNTAEGVAREEPVMRFIVLGYLVLGLLMAYVYPKGYAAGSPVAEGLKFGIVMGLLWVLPHGLVLHGVHQVGTGGALIVDALWHLVEQGLGGIVIGLVYGRPAVQEPAEAQT